MPYRSEGDMVSLAVNEARERNEVLHLLEEMTLAVPGSDWIYVQLAFFERIHGLAHQTTLPPLWLFCDPRLDRAGFSNLVFRDVRIVPQIGSRDWSQEINNALQV